jgi:hypothetical protein
VVTRATVIHSALRAFVVLGFTALMLTHFGAWAGAVALVVIILATE